MGGSALGPVERWAFAFSFSLLFLFLLRPPHPGSDLLTIIPLALILAHAAAVEELILHSPLERSFLSRQRHLSCLRIHIQGALPCFLDPRTNLACRRLVSPSTSTISSSSRHLRAQHFWLLSFSIHWISFIQLVEKHLPWRPSSSRGSSSRTLCGQSANPRSRRAKAHVDSERCRKLGSPKQSAWPSQRLTKRYATPTQKTLNDSTLSIHN